MPATSRTPLSVTLLIAMVVMVAAAPLFAQEQSRESMAVDATASQWSFQFAGEGFWGYKDDVLDDGTTRLPGNKGFLQFRLVAPIPKSEKNPLTWLPRLTLRTNKNKDGDVGFGSSDIFILGIINQWATGRWGLGPQINFPAQEGFGSTEWGLGLAGAVTQRAMGDKLFFAFLLQQTWSKDPAGSDETKAAPLSINPTFVFQLGDGWYIGNGDYVIRYNWDASAWLIPFGARLGKAFIQPTKTYNAYVEYASSLYYDDWPGPVPGHSIRINFQFQIPVGL
jgi:hypothetical protein